MLFRRVAVALVCIHFACARAAALEPVRFDVEVMAVLSKAGCNQGACHGNLNGKGGFKLSLRGEDPRWDFGVLTRDMFGRRIDQLRPAESLILKKATGSVPHEGGRRFEIGSPEYEILRLWIAAGSPAAHPGAPALTELRAAPSQRIAFEPEERVPLRVWAMFSDGVERDVTGLAAFETSNLSVASVEGGVVTKIQNGETTIAVRFLNRHATVRLAFVPARPDFRWSGPPEANFVDHRIFAKLRTLRLNPSALSDDAMFLRRVFIDVIGALPTIDEAKAFRADARPNKRARLIDSLLQRSEFSDYWALKWCDLLRNEEKTIDRKGVQAFHGWIRKCIAEGKPLNEFARELIAARGSTYAEPAANYYRALRDPLARAEATAQVFLGLRLQCARCHNHPFDHWTQNDYFQLAAFFPRVRYRIIENNRRDNFDKHEFIGEQIVWLDRAGEVMHPRTNRPAEPAFLDGRRVALPSDDDRLVALADWVARPDNPFFARAQVNRVWGHLLGHALVEPNDDFRTTNPPSHPSLLDDLARDFTDHHFDLRHLIRTIANSRTYQLSWLPNETNRDDELNCAHARVQRLEAEVLLDALTQVMQVPVKFAGQPLGTRAVQLPGVQPRQRGDRLGHGEKFLRAFGKPDRLLSCDCERNDDTTIPQSLLLLTGEPLVGMLRDPDNRLHRLLQAGKTDAEILEEFCVAAYSRPPNDTEKKALAAHVAKSKDRGSALEDFVWALLNTKEFQVRR